MIPSFFHLAVLAVALPSSEYNNPLHPDIYITDKVIVQPKYIYTEIYLYIYTSRSC